MLDHVHAIYRRRNRAIVTKCNPALVGTPGKMKPGEPSDVDYVGVAGHLQGVGFAFDAKGVTDRATYDPPDPRDPKQYARERRQLEYLRDVQRQGGAGFLLLHCWTLAGCWVLTDVAALLAGRSVPIRSLNRRDPPTHHLPYVPEASVLDIARGAPRWDYLPTARAAHAAPARAVDLADRPSSISCVHGLATQ